MHPSLPTWLAFSAAALLPTATAFYPYQHSGSSISSPASARRRIPQSSDPSARSIKLPLRRVPTPIRPRQNIHDIVDSKEPKQEHSVAIDQDGGDLSYMVAVKFGDGEEEYNLLLDSAASYTWVMGQECANAACKTHNTLGEGDSSTLKMDTTLFSITYGSGSAEGTLASDTIHIGGLSPSLTFGLATNVSQDFRSYPMDGILGLGSGGPSTSNAIDAPQFMDVLSSNKLIDAKLYGIHMSRDKDGLMDGELNIGEVNKDRFSGDINYMECVDNDKGFWEIPIEDAGVDGKTAGLNGRTAIVDTGTSYILMPEDDALAIHSQIPGFQQDGETFSVPCDTAAVIQFSFNKQAYNISTADWRGDKLDSGLCRSNIVGRQTFSETQWLVGDVFLKNVYSVFDYDNKRVGFGVKGKEVKTRSTPTSVSVSASSSGASPTASRTALTSSPGGADATTAPETQPQQDSQSGAVGRTSASVFAYLVAFATLSMFI